MFADFFGSVFTEENFVEPPETDFYGIEINNLQLTYNDVFFALRGLRGVSTSGPDDLPEIFLKNCAYSLTYPITILFNMSLSTGIFPEIWKESFITPVFKAGAIDDAQNYRPVNKLNAIAQLLDSLVHKKLSLLFDQCLISEQHGFRKGRSTTTNLINYTEMIHQSFTEKVQVDALYTDFSKAFDKLNHAALLYKLRCSGIKGSLLRWMESYLRNRTQIVKIRNARSKKVHGTSGVPQGSHLGPLLFLLFVNDVHWYLDPDVCLALFADDCKLFFKIVSILDCIFLQRNLDLFHDYCQKFLLKLNLKKCFKMTFTRRTEPIEFDYTFDGKSIEAVSVVRDLGVLLDSRLNFKDHINHICSKAFKMLGFVIRTCKDFRNPNAVLVSYYSLVRSHLEYASQVWNPSLAKDSMQIEKIQRKFTRFLFNKNLIQNYTENEYHYHSALNVLSLRSLESRRTCADLMLLLKILFGRIAGLSIDEFVRQTNVNMNLRSQRILVPSISNCSSMNRMIRTFNNLELDLRIDLNENSFSQATRLMLDVVPMY